MAQLFHPATNAVARGSIFAAFGLAVGAGWVVAAVTRSPYITGTGVVRQQPVPFSHKHHVAGIGIDCRYCHLSVEDGPVAGIPPSSVCMQCHTQIWADSPMLAPVRESFRTGRPVSWTRVHDLPDFAYFDHSIHVARGVACTTCHGRVDQMPLVWKEHSLFMEWCLECHRDPERFVGPRSKVFDPDAAPGGASALRLARPTDCSTCHR